MGFVSSKENSNDPNEWFREKGSKEILESVNKDKKRGDLSSDFSIVETSQPLTKQLNRSNKEF